jgi:histone H3/H4
MPDLPAAPETSEPPAPRELRELTIVQTRVHELVRARDKRVSDKFLVALSEHVEQVIAKAIERATANGRSTLRPEDV